MWKNTEVGPMKLELQSGKREWAMTFPIYTLLAPGFRRFGNEKRWNFRYTTKLAGRRPTGNEIWQICNSCWDGFQTLRLFSSPRLLLCLAVADSLTKYITILLTIRVTKHLIQIRRGDSTTDETLRIYLLFPDICLNCCIVLTLIYPVQ